jgi:hypothetical protein
LVGGAFRLNKKWVGVLRKTLVLILNIAKVLKKGVNTNSALE